MDEKIKLTKNEGAIILRETSEPEVYSPQAAGELPDNIRFTLAFFLYAVEREDWIEEFDNFIKSLQDKHDEVDASIRRSQFEVIQGDKK